MANKPIGVIFNLLFLQSFHDKPSSMRFAADACQATDRTVPLWSRRDRRFRLPLPVAQNSTIYHTVRILLIPHNAACRTRPPVAGSRRQGSPTKRAGRVCGWRDRFQSPSQRRLQSAEDIDQQYNCRGRCSDTAEPTADGKFRIRRDYPKDDRNGDQCIDAGPFYGFSHSRSAVRVPIAYATNPMPPEADRQNRDPE